MALQFSSSQNLTITAGGIAQAANRSSAAVTTSIDKNIVSILLTVSILTTSTAPSSSRQVFVYGYYSMDGINYIGASTTIDNVDGTDKTLTAIGNPTNLKWIGTINLNQGAVAATISGVFEVTSSLGTIPPKWGIVLYNDAGTTLGATVTATYREVYYT